MIRRSRLERGGGRLSTLKKILLSVLVVGLLSTVTYKRVYATMSAGATDRGSSAASGTLAIDDTDYAKTAPTTLTAGTVCQSYKSPGAGNVNATCPTVSWNLSVAGLQYPGQVGLGYVAIRNAGSLPASQLQLSIPTCTTTNTTGVPAYVIAGTGGTGDPCTGGLDMYVQEVDNFSTIPPPMTAPPGGVARCVYPANYYDTTVVPDCSTAWMDDTVSLLKGVSCWDLGPVAANSTRYFVIGMRLNPTTATNAEQGRQTAVTFKWHLQGGNYTYDVNGHLASSTCANPNSFGIGQ